MKELIKTQDWRFNHFKTVVTLSIIENIFQKGGKFLLIFPLLEDLENRYLVHFVIKEKGKMKN